jgi:poly(3-hydroxybutyrate) depolymerase
MTLHSLLVRHMLTGGEIFRKILHDDGNDTSAHPFTGILMSPVAIPGEFFLDTVSAVFHDSALAEGRLRWRGLVVDPRAIMDVALLTIEAEEDDIAAPGQTYIAHTLCRTIPNAMRGHHSQPSIGHFGLFHGVVWRQIILPRLCKFLMEHQRVTVA